MTETTSSTRKAAALPPSALTFTGHADIRDGLIDTLQFSDDATGARVLPIPTAINGPVWLHGAAYTLERLLPAGHRRMFLLHLIDVIPAGLDNHLGDVADTWLRDVVGLELLPASAPAHGAGYDFETAIMLRRAHIHHDTLNGLSAVASSAADHARPAARAAAADVANLAVIAALGDPRLFMDAAVRVTGSGGVVLRWGQMAHRLLHLLAVHALTAPTHPA